MDFLEFFHNVADSFIRFSDNNFVILVNLRRINIPIEQLDPKFLKVKLAIIEKYYKV